MEQIEFTAQQRPTDIYAMVGLDAYQSGDYEGARAIFETGLAMARDEGDTETIISFLNNLAAAYDALETPAEAEEAFQEALCVAVQKLVATHPRLSGLLHNYAVLLSRHEDELLAEGMHACAEAMHLHTYRYLPYALFESKAPGLHELIEQVA
jgi:tetratricopeptide (TPR) repeat protein